MKNNITLLSILITTIVQLSFCLLFINVVEFSFSLFSFLAILGIGIYIYFNNKTEKHKKVGMGIIWGSIIAMLLFFTLVFWALSQFGR
jgi:hypothetical protein